jgi:hypothetical protein
MRSPVFSLALGECKAVTSREFGQAGLTFVSSLETAFGASHKGAYQDRSGPSDLCILTSTYCGDNLSLLDTRQARVHV